VFVAFHDPADIVRSAITRELQVPAWPVDGRTSPGDRQTAIDRFVAHVGPAALVLNPSVAGLGLNLQAASHVIHYTLEWNPAREAQATARAWRHGQTRPVTVHRLYYAGTIDEALIEMMQRKRDLFDAVVQESPDSGADFRQLLRRVVELNDSSDIESD